MITYNPMVFVKMPKESKCLVPKKDTFSLSPGQIQIFKEACLTKTKAGAYKYRYGLVLLYNESVKWIINEIMTDNRKRGIVTDYVCSSETGGCATARNLQRTLDTIVAKTDLPHIWLHILRHTFGSELIRQGINVSVVSKLMGHADINITYRTYIHVIESETRKAMNKVSIA